MHTKSTKLGFGFLTITQVSKYTAAQVRMQVRKYASVRVHAQVCECASPKSKIPIQNGCQNTHKLDFNKSVIIKII